MNRAAPTRRKHPKPGTRLTVEEMTRNGVAAVGVRLVSVPYQLAVFSLSVFFVGPFTSHFAAI